MSKPRRSPLSVWFSEAERAQLAHKAGDLPLGVYIKQAVLGAAPSRRAPRVPVADKAALAAILGLLGKSHLSSNLNQLAKAANMGALPVTPEVQAEFRAACADIRDMRELLLKALGIKAHRMPIPLAGRFSEAAVRVSR